MSHVRASSAITVIAAILATGFGCDALKPADYDEFVVDTDPDAVADSDDSASAPVVPVNDNTPPRANAGPDQRGLSPDQAVLLDGSGSSDLDGDPLQYTWTLLQKPPTSIASITSATSISGQIYVDEPGNYQIELKVSDGVEEDTDTVLLVVDQANQKPTADAGFDQFVSAGAIVQLSGAGSFDPDGDQLSYTWDFQLRPTGSVATLAGNQVQPALSPRFTADKPGAYAIQLVVSDGSLSSDPDIVNVTVQDTSGSSGGSSGSSSDCLSCSAYAAEQADVTLKAGDAAGTLGLFGLPMLALLLHRRREE